MATSVAVRVLVGLTIVVIVTRLPLNDWLDVVVSTVLLGVAGCVMFPFMFRRRHRHAERER